MYLQTPEIACSKTVDLHWTVTLRTNEGAVYIYIYIKSKPFSASEPMT